jgi:superfamily I DNA/RNA helicase/RecB family exonuclease
VSQPVDTLPAMDLTAEQRAAVGHHGARTAVVGDRGTGKTTTLIARYLRLAMVVPPARILVLCRDRAMAQRFTLALLPHLRGGFDALPVTTVYGLATSLLPERRLLSAAEQRVRVRQLLAREQESRWPTLGHLLRRPAFEREVVAGLAEVQVVGAEAAEAAGGVWAELAGFAGRYREALAQAGEVDASLLLAEAAPRAPRFDHVIVDDADALSVLGARLVTEVARRAAGLTVASLPDPRDGVAPLLAGATCVARLPAPFRTVPPGRLVRCGHPSIEPEAIAGELLAVHAQGVAWTQMAVILRQLGRRARSIARALARHGIPVAAVPALALEEPAVRTVLDLLRWLDGDEGALHRLLVSPLGPDAATVRALRRSEAAEGQPLEADPRLAGLVRLRDHLRGRQAAGDGPAELAYEAWSQGLADLADAARPLPLGAVDDRALDALVALTDGLAHLAARNPGASLGQTLDTIEEGGLVPDPWRVNASAGPEAVTISSIDDSAGKEWHTVVVAGCVEGELPRPPRRTPLFDPALLNGGSAGAPPADRSGELMDAERTRFDLATSRATTQLLATAAPQPGVLLSRFVEGWPVSLPRLPLAPGQPPPVRAATAGPVPVAPEGRLHLSATQLDTYDDCPLRYAYQYVLRAKDEPGVHASLGSLVHRVLAAFLDPSASHPRTFESLMAVATDVWRDDVARYRPQVEEARRDFVSMVTEWWHQEGCAPDVLAVERRFRFDVGPHSVEGAIDRIDRADDGVGIRVVDYKTGKREPTAAEVAEDLQLAIYHLAATRDPELVALGPPTQLQLRYLRTMRTYDQPVTDDHAGDTERRVLAAAERILAEDFSPSVHANCRTCSFHRLCPLQPEGRQVAGT